MKHKSIDIKPLFELRDCASPESPESQTLFNLYTEFLNTVSSNTVLGYRISKKDKKYLDIIKKLVNYAESKIKIKDTITIKNGNNNHEIKFYDYITEIIKVRGAKYVNISAAHIIEHNQAASDSRNSLFSLESILKSRVGLSCLANMIRDEYFRISITEKHDKLLPQSPSMTYSSTLTPKYVLPIDTLSAKEAKENYVPLDVPFHPMGHYHDDDAR